MKLFCCLSRNGWSVVIISSTAKNMFLQFSFKKTQKKYIYIVFTDFTELISQNSNCKFYFEVDYT